MKSPEVSSRALTVWVTTAMVGPVALVSAGSSWSALAVVAILCGVLCAAVYKSWEGGVCNSKLVNVLFLLWNVYAVAAVASMAGQCWPGKESQIATSLVLIALGALSASKGERSACAVSATLFPLCAAIFAIVLICGIGSIRWDRVEVSTVPPGGMLIFVFLLPIAAVTIPRSANLSVGGLAFIGLLGIALSVSVMGTLSLPVMLTKKDAFFEFSKGLNLFGVVQRFEAVVAVAVTLSLYAMLSLLLSSIGSMAERVCPGSSKWAVHLSAVLSIVIEVFELWLSAKVTALVSIFVWGFLGAAQRIFGEKKKKNLDISS